MNEDEEKKLLLEKAIIAYDKYIDLCANTHKENVNQQKQRNQKLSSQIMNNSKIKEVKATKYFLDNYMDKVTDHKICLLSDFQEHDETLCCQKLMDLFLEENETIVDNGLNANNVDDYLILQLYTALSSQSRKLYCESENKEETRRAQLSFCAINNVFFDKNNEIDSKTLELFNHNIITTDDINHDSYKGSKRRSIASNIKKENELKEEEKTNDVPIVDAIEFDSENPMKIVFEEMEELDKRKVKEKKEHLNFRIRKFIQVQNFLDKDPTFFDDKTQEEIEEYLIKMFSNEEVLSNKDDFELGNEQANEFIIREGFTIPRIEKKNSFSYIEPLKQQEIDFE